MKLTKKRIKTFVRRYRVALGVVGFIILLASYLNTANNHFYHHLHTAGLVWPQIEQSYTIGDINSPSRSYVALGDSLTSGIGASSYQKSYAYLVAGQIQKPSQSVILTPLSTPGYKSSDLVKNNLDKTISLKPDLITILIGVNDTHGFGPSANEFRASYDTLLRRLSSETHASIYAISFPYIGKDSLIWPPYKNYYGARTITFNTIIKELASKYGVHYIDLYTATISYANTSSPYYSKDDFHPSNEGYQTWAGIIARDINN